MRKHILNKQWSLNLFIILSLRIIYQYVNTAYRLNISLKHEADFVSFRLKYETSGPWNIMNTMEILCTWVVVLYIFYCKQVVYIETSQIQLRKNSLKPCANLI